MKRLKFLFMSILMVSFFGCEQDDYEFGDIQSPTNLVITADILGADDDNPFGDGKASKRIISLFKKKYKNCL